MFDTDVRRNEKKPWLNKTINISTNYLVSVKAMMDRSERSDILILYNLFLIRLFVCVLIRP